MTLFAYGVNVRTRVYVLFHWLKASYLNTLCVKINFNSWYFSFVRAFKAPASKIHVIYVRILGHLTECKSGVYYNAAHCVFTFDAGSR